MTALGTTRGSIVGVKLSVSLPEEDVAYLDALVEDSAAESRSAALHRAVAALRESRLEEAYVAAWDEWVAEGHAEVWDPTAADGLDAPR
jgi:Arc/MetJ-type ribon-helix-helix transcriptional regulator